MQHEAVSADAPNLCFQTFFGPSPIEFRLAALEPFGITVDYPDDREGLLRFIG